MKFFKMSSDSWHVDLIRFHFVIIPFYESNKNLAGMDNESNYYHEYVDLYKALQSGELYAAREFFMLRPNAVNAKITVLGQTALHVAVVARHLHIVEELVELMWEKTLEIEDDKGNTALFEALLIGNYSMAKCMLDKNKNLVHIGEKSKILPVVTAIQYGYTQLARELYHLTPLEDLMPEKGVNGATLCTQAIYTRNLGKNSSSNNASVVISDDLKSSQDKSLLVQCFLYAGTKQQILLCS
jgi:ankyrin repeat protein